MEERLSLSRGSAFRMSAIEFCYWDFHFERELRLLVLTKGVFFTRIVSEHSTIHCIPHALVHFDRKSVRDTHEQIDKVSIVVVDGQVFQIIHQLLRKAYPPELWGYSHSSHVPVP